jgi:hypothetical protein
VDSPTPRPLEVVLELNDLLFTPGDAFELSCAVIHETGDSVAAHLFVLLDVYGEYYFWPSWGQALDYDPLSLGPGEGLPRFTVLAFTWPEVTGSAEGLLFWGALVNEANTELLAPVVRIEWAYRGTAGV